MNPTGSVNLKGLTHWLPLAALGGMLSMLPATAQENDGVQSIIGQMNHVLRNDAGHDPSEVRAAVETLNRSLMSVALEEAGGTEARPLDYVDAGEVEVPIAVGGSAAAGLGGNTGDSDNPAGYYLPPGDQEPFGGDPLEDTLVGYADESSGEDSPVDDGFFDDSELDGDGDSGGDGGSTPGSG